MDWRRSGSSCRRTRSACSPCRRSPGGWWVDSAAPGSSRAGLATLAIAALIAAGAPPDGGAILTLALFLLGYGWNLGFVAGSSMLTSGLTLSERTRVQGMVDGMIWTSAALASLSSGLVVAGAGYTTLGLLGVALLIPPAAVLVARRRAVGVGRPA